MFRKFEGGGSWSDFPGRFRGGVVVVVMLFRKFEGGVVGAIFRADFEGGSR